jgi:predicted TIM-barrel fold metal-dependent hydrolase
VILIAIDDRLIFSTDYPFQQPSRGEITTFLDQFASDTDRQEFSSANAAALYGIA